VRSQSPQSGACLRTQSSYWPKLFCPSLNPLKAGPAFGLK